MSAAAAPSAFHFLDSHNHYQRALRGGGQAIPPMPDVAHCPMAIDESDWAHMVTLLDREDVVAAGAGLHPWFAHKRSSDWATRLAGVLEAEPRLIVGEIGLDKVARTPDTGKVEWEEQMCVFEEQMALASSLGRPVSMHCVKAHGTLFDWLRARTPKPPSKRKKKERAKSRQEEEGGGGDSSGGEGSEEEEEEPAPVLLLPPAVALHSYTGSVDMAKAFLSLSSTEVYLGFSAPINMKTEGMASKMKEVLRHVPLDRVLLESDLEDASDLRDSLVRACDAIAEAKAEEGVTAQEVAAITAANARRFMSTRRHDHQS